MTPKNKAEAERRKRAKTLQREYEKDTSTRAALEQETGNPGWGAQAEVMKEAARAQTARANGKGRLPNYRGKRKRKP